MTLTPRETQIGAMLMDGLSNKVIAHKLGRSQQTVANQINNIYWKLKVDNRVDAVVKLKGITFDKMYSFGD